MRFPHLGFLMTRRLLLIFVVPSSHLTCSLPRRRGNSHACYRFSNSDLRLPEEDLWLNTGATTTDIEFTVNKSILFHGVCLFGHGKDELYKVTSSGNCSIYRSRYFKNHTYSDNQTYSNNSYSAFDVFLPSGALSVLLPINQ